MNREKMIEKMVSKMGEWAIENRMCFNSKHAESLAHFLLEKDDSEGLVVLTKEELAEKYVMKETYDFVVQLFEKKCLEYELLSDRCHELKVQLKQAREKTAKEILNVVGKKEDCGHIKLKDYIWFKQLEEKYGVELE